MIPKMHSVDKYGQTRKDFKIIGIGIASKRKTGDIAWEVAQESIQQWLKEKMPYEPFVVSLLYKQVNHRVEGWKDDQKE